MKTLAIALFLNVYQLAVAIPHQPFEEEEITGAVEFAVWRSAIKLKRVIATPKGEEQNRQTDTLPEHWILLLRGVRGLSGEQRNQISWAFAGGELPVDWSRKRFLQVQDQNYLYLRVDGDSDWPIKIESIVTPEKVSYAGADFSGWITLHTLELDGKALKLPATRQNGNEKFEKGGADQPATTDSELIPESHDKLQTESMPAPRWCLAGLNL
jgi:hypothetical protein